MPGIERLAWTAAAREDHLHWQSQKRRQLLSNDTRFSSSGDTKIGPPVGGQMAVCRRRLDLLFLGGCHVLVGGGGA